jgi:chemotaxis protein methyltransferase CheR
VAWALAVAPRHPGLALEVLATDIDDGQLGRARTACYPTAALRELPEAWRRAAFDERDEEACLREPFRGSVRFVRHDLRTPPPAPGPFDLILCRNLAFSYFDEPLQRAVAATFHAALRPGGVLVVGGHEALPHGTPGFAPAGRCLLRAQPLT